MISMIVAVDQNYGIGYKNELLCDLKDDMKHFVKTTKGKAVIMGYNTFMSLGEKPLKNRVNFVCTPSPAHCNFYYKELLEKEHDLFFDVPAYFDHIIEENPENEFVVIGGAQIYKLYLPKVDRLYLTRIHHTFENVDAFFPELDLNEWDIVDEKEFEKNEDNEYSFSILTLERVQSNGSEKAL